MPDPADHTPADAPLSPQDAERLAQAMSAYTAASRLRILYALVTEERAVDEIARATGLGVNVVSQQLRVLRQLGAVTVRRDGRRAHYRLRDHHMVDLLAAIRHHGEHGAGREAAAPAPPSPSPD